MTPGIVESDTVTAPGVPKNYPDPKKLVTQDCIRPLTATTEFEKRLA